MQDAQNDYLHQATRTGMLEQRANNAQQAKKESQQMLLQKKDDALGRFVLRRIGQAYFLAPQDRESGEKQNNSERCNYIKSKKDEALRRKRLSSLGHQLLLVR
eukprot:5321078-Amphidinium_carterae.1